MTIFAKSFILAIGLVCRWRTSPQAPSYDDEREERIKGLSLLRLYHPLLAPSFTGRVFLADFGTESARGEWGSPSPADGTGPDVALTAALRDLDSQAPPFRASSRSFFSCSKLAQGAFFPSRANCLRKAVRSLTSCSFLIPISEADYAVLLPGTPTLGRKN
jgi:hypothetical protein